MKSVEMKSVSLHGVKKAKGQNPEGAHLPFNASAYQTVCDKGERGAKLSNHLKQLVSNDG